jgi:hypothetical protein
MYLVFCLDRHLVNFVDPKFDSNALLQPPASMYLERLHLRITDALADIHLCEAWDDMVVAAFAFAKNVFIV